MNRQIQKPFAAWNQDDLRRAMEPIATNEVKQLRKNGDIKAGHLPYKYTPEEITAAQESVLRCIRDHGPIVASHIKLHCPDLAPGQITGALRGLTVRKLIASDMPSTAKKPRAWYLAGKGK